jgi:hypothetical protein
MGIEPATKAAEYASSRGIEILGPTIDDHVDPTEMPGVVTAFDVIEHVVNPYEFLRRMRDCMAEDGCLILMTGATDSWTFRLFGRHYWYSALPEHVTFYNLKWFHWAAGKLGMRIVSHTRLSTESRRLQEWLFQAAIISIHTIVQSLKRAGVSDKLIACLPHGRLALTWKTVPWWKQAADHMIIVLANNRKSG